MKQKTTIILSVCILAGVSLSVASLVSRKNMDMTKLNVEVLVQNENPTSGTCCPCDDPKQKCEIGNHPPIYGYYYKESGPCPQQ